MFFVVPFLISFKTILLYLIATSTPYFLNSLQLTYLTYVSLFDFKFINPLYTSEITGTKNGLQRRL